MDYNIEILELTDKINSLEPELNLATEKLKLLENEHSLLQDQYDDLDIEYSSYRTNVNNILNPFKYVFTREYTNKYSFYHNTPCGVDNEMEDIEIYVPVDVIKNIFNDLYEKLL